MTVPTRCRGIAAALAILLSVLLSFSAGHASAQEAGRDDRFAAAWQRLTNATKDERSDLLLQLFEDIERRGTELEDDPTADSAAAEQILRDMENLLREPGKWPIEAAEIVARLAETVHILETRLKSNYLPYGAYELAGFAMWKRQFAAATEILDAALARWPASTVLHLQRVELLRMQNDWLGAAAEVAITERLLELPAASASGNDREHLKLTKAGIDRRLGRVDRALLVLRELLLDPRCDDQIRSAAIDALADTLLAGDRPERVLENDAQMGNRVDRKASPEYDLKLAMARAALALIGEGSPAEALRELRASVERPEVSEAARWLGTTRSAELALDMGDVATAALLLQSADAMIARWTARSPRDTARERPHQDALSLAVLRAAHAPAAEVTRAEDAVLESCKMMLADWSRTQLLPGGVSFLRSMVHRLVLHEALGVSLRRGGPETALDLLIEAQSMGSLARTESVAPPDLAQVRAALLARGEVLLVYFPTRLSSHLFVVTATDVAYHALEPQWQLARKLTALGQAVQEGATEEVLRERARDLGHSLLPPEVLTAIQGATHVRIAGADLLAASRPARGPGLTCSDLQQAAAFELLPLASGRLLGFEQPITYLPSLPLGVFLRQRWETRAPSPAGPLACLAIGDPRRADGTNEFLLDGAALMAPFGGRATVLDLTTQDPGGLAALIQPTRSFAFVGHGAIDRNLERFAGLVARASGPNPHTIWADELERLPLPPLVMLAACGAAEGPVRFGEDGTSHLGGAAFKANACTVAIGIGDLPAAATIDLMGAVHRELAQGHTPAIALRNARRATCPEETISQLVVLSGFRLHGLGDEPTMPALSKRTSAVPIGLVAVIVLALVLIGLLFLALRRRAHSSS